MAFYSCNRYRLIVLLLLVLIMWQFFRLLPDKPVTQISEAGIVELEDDKYNKHKQDKVKVEGLL